jgi:hypothetical protein
MRNGAFSSELVAWSEEKDLAEGEYAWQEERQTVTAAVDYEESE